MADLRSVMSGFDLDSGGGTELIMGVSLRLTASGGSVEALGQQTMAVSIPVVIASNQSAIAVDTEMGPAAALTDNFANPSVGGVGAFLMLWDSATWDRAPGTTVDGQLVNLGANNDVTVTSGAITADTELATAAALTDNFANPTTAPVGAFSMLWDSANWDRAPGTSVDGALVNLGANNDVTVTSGAITADTELPAAAALTADAVSSPTAPAVAGFGFGYNGTNWDRIRTANTGRLQVDVLSGGGAPAAPTSPTADYITSAALAAGSEANLDTADIGAKKLAQVTAWSSVAYRARVFLVLNSVEASEALAVGGGGPGQPWTWTPPHADFATTTSSAGTDGFRVEMVNLDDANAADVHAVVLYST